MNRQERQHELRKSIADFEARRGKLAQEAKLLDAKRNEHADTLESLKQTHSAACRAEALGQSNDREKIERDISATSARLAGTQTLIAEKQSEIRQVDDQRAPLEDELRKLNAAEEHDRCLAEIEQSLKDGKDEVRKIFALQKAHVDRCNHLTSNYADAGVDVRSAAHGVAEKLAAARNGVRIFEAFTPDEMKEMKTAKLIS